MSVVAKKNIVTHIDEIYIRFGHSPGSEAIHSDRAMLQKICYSVHDTNISSPIVCTFHTITHTHTDTQIPSQTDHAKRDDVVIASNQCGYAVEVTEDRVGMAKGAHTHSCSIGIKSEEHTLLCECVCVCGHELGARTTSAICDTSLIERARLAGLAGCSGGGGGAGPTQIWLHIFGWQINALHSLRVHVCVGVCVCVRVCSAQTWHNWWANRKMRFSMDDSNCCGANIVEVGRISMRWKISSTDWNRNVSYKPIRQPAGWPIFHLTSEERASSRLGLWARPLLIIHEWAGK